MNKKYYVIISLIIFLMLLFSNSCKKDDNPITPEPESDVKIPSTTKNITSSDYSSYFVGFSSDSTQLTFKTEANSKYSFKVNDVVVISEGEGLLKKITNIATSGNQIVLTTEDATITEAIEKGKINMEMNLSADIIDGGYMAKARWDEVAKISLKLFKRGQEIALERGLILVDTKYEFGLTDDGQIMLIDEIHTPDSSRYWQAGSYKQRIDAGQEPENFDKEFLRIWFKENCDPYKDEKLPEAPKDMVVELANRYIHIYEQMTGEKFQVDLDTPVLERIGTNLSKYLINR